jgi:proteasome accessory factor A
VGESPRPESGPSRFRISQREPFVDRVLTTSAVGENPTKPLVMSRDEPLADRHRWRRVQIVGGDATMAEYATWLRVGTTLVALRLIAAGCDPAVELDDPIAALRAYSADPDLRGAVRTDQGRWRAIDVQRAWVDAATKASFLSREERAVVAAWADTVEALASDPELVADRVDWVAKRRLLDSLAGRGASEARLVAADLTWHDVREDRGLWARAGLRRVASSHRVLQALHRAPLTTRAGVRATLIRHLRHADAAWDGDWCSITCHRPEPAVIRLDDPHAGSDERADELSAALEAAPHRAPVGWRWPSPEALRHESAGLVARPHVPAAA